MKSLHDRYTITGFSQSLITERHQLMVLFVQHHIEQTHQTKPSPHSVYVVTLPRLPILLLLQVLVTVLDRVTRHVGIQVMDVVVLNTVGKRTQP